MKKLRIPPGHFPQSIAIDSSTGDIYFADYEHCRIGRVSPDGTDIQILWRSGIYERKRPENLVLDTKRQYMFFSTFGDTQALTSEAQLLRANMDDMDDRKIKVIESTKNIDDYRLHKSRPSIRASKRVYWTDSMGHMISYS